MTSAFSPSTEPPAPGVPSTGHGAPSSSEPAPGASGLTRWNLGLFALAFAPLLVVFGMHLWDRPQYQFFPMALAGAVFLGWQRAKELDRPLEPGHPFLIILLLAFSLSLLCAGALIWSPWLAMAAAWMGFAGVLWWMGGWRLTSALLPTLVLLLTIIPPPLSLDERMTMQLRTIAVTWSSRMLDHLGVIHCLSGNLIELPQQKLMVEEACSGINSVLFTTAICIFYFFWKRRGLLCILASLPLVLGSVLLGNVFRITFGAWLRFNGGIDLLSGWPHEALGMALLVFYLGLIISLEHFLYWPPLAASNSALKVSRPLAANISRIPRRIAPYWGWVAAGLFLAAGLGALPRGWAFHQYTQGQQQVGGKSALLAGTKFVMPEQLDGWQRLSKDTPLMHKVETLGISSQSWSYRKKNLVATVALDYPFKGYHDVMVCYTAAGWTIKQRDDIAAPAAGEPTAVKLVMEKQPVSFGYLWYSTINEKGRWIDAPQTQRSMIDRWTMESDLSSYRVQVFVAGNVPLTDAERGAVNRLFEEARTSLIRQFMEQIQPK